MNAESSRVAKSSGGRSSRLAAGLLTGRQKLAWWYREVERLTDSQAAQRMGISRESFNRLYHRAAGRVAGVERLFGEVERDLIRRAVSESIAPLTFRRRHFGAVA